MKRTRPFDFAALFGLVFGLALAGPSAAQAVKQGAGTYFLQPKSGDKAMPDAPGRTDALKKTAAQTNQWYSALLFNAKPEVIFAQPLTIKASPAGLEMSLPSKEVRPSERRKV